MFLDSWIHGQIWICYDFTYDFTYLSSVKISQNHGGLLGQPDQNQSYLSKCWLILTPKKDILSSENWPKDP